MVHAVVGYDPHKDWEESLALAADRLFCLQCRNERHGVKDGAKRNGLILMS